MCGRYSLLKQEDELKERFKVKKIAGHLTPRFNAAPTQQLPLIPNSDPEIMILAEWGIAPAWMKDEKSPKRLINARAETVFDKPTFKAAVAKRRCLVIADGFYEWAVVPEEKTKQPFRIVLKDEAPFAMAGIYEIQKDKQGAEVIEFAIITVASNTLMAKIHNRMPAILLPEDEKRWLDNDISTKDAIKMLKAYPANKMKAYPISREVNSPANDNPTVIAELPTQKPLF